jgi:hypothetical protein
MDASTLVDRDRYPIDRPGGDACAALVASARRDLDTKALALFPGFLPPRAVVTMVAEAMAPATRAPAGTAGRAAGSSALKAAPQREPHGPGDLLDRAPAVDVEHVFDRALDEDDAQVGDAQQQVAQAPARQGLVDDAPLRLERRHREQGDDDGDDAQHDLPPAADPPDVGVKGGRHRKVEPRAAPSTAR